MTVKVLVKRVVPKEKEGELLVLIKELRGLTTRQPGYVSGETYRRIDDPGENLVISTWQSLQDWENWFGSRERAVIQDRIDALLGKTTTPIVYGYF